MWMLPMLYRLCSIYCTPSTPSTLQCLICITDNTYLYGISDRSTTWHVASKCQHFNLNLFAYLTSRNVFLTDLAQKFKKFAIFVMSLEIYDEPIITTHNGWFVHQIYSILYRYMIGWFVYYSWFVNHSSTMQLVNYCLFNQSFFTEVKYK